MQKGEYIQKSIDDYVSKKYPRFYYDFESLIKQYKARYGNIPFDDVDLFEFSFQMHGHSKLRGMPANGFYTTYSRYLKIKQRDNY